MTQADSVHSTPPTNTSAIDDPQSPGKPHSRRSVLGAIAAGATALTLAPARAAARTLDAELIELGARFEPLVDQYYVARKRWARSLVSAHAEHDREFGDPADRNYE
jgi:hypothetical protein